MKHTLQHLATHTRTRPFKAHTVGRGVQTRYSCSRQQPAQRIIDTSAVVAPDSQTLGDPLETVDGGWCVGRTLVRGTAAVGGAVWSKNNVT